MSEHLVRRGCKQCKVLATRIEKLEAENKMVHKRMDWTIDDNVEKAIRIKELEVTVKRSGA